MKYRLSLLLILLFSTNISFSQHILKTASDTAFIMEYILFPQVNINLAISFDATDLSKEPAKIYKENDIARLQAKLKGGNEDCVIYDELAAVYRSLKQQTKSDSMLQIARNLYMNKVNANPADTAAIRALAKMFVNARQLDLADMYYKELIRLHPSDVNAWCGLSGVYFAANDVQSASQLMDSAFSHGENSIGAYCQLAAIEYMKAFATLSQMPDSAAAELTFDRIIDYSDIRSAIAKHPDNEAFSLLYNGMKLAGILVEAVVKNQEKLSTHSDSLRFVLSDTATHELKKIEQSLNKSAQNNYKNRKFVHECLMFCSMLQNENERSRRYFDAGIKGLPEASKTVLFHSMMGIYALNGLYREALDIQLLLNQVEPVTENYQVTAFLYFSVEEYKSARDFIKKVQALQPMEVKAKISLAAIALKEMKPAESRSILMEAGMIEPDNEELIFLQSVTDIFLNKAASATYALDYLIGKDFHKQDCLTIRQRLL